MKSLLLFVSVALAEVYLDKFDRQIFRNGLHRELETNVTYTLTKEEDIEHCSFVVRENITKDMYIYYEEVNRDLPGFQTWPHHKKMDIEAPASQSESMEFMWRIPFSHRHADAWMVEFRSHEINKGSSMPQ